MSRGIGKLRQLWNWHVRGLPTIKIGSLGNFRHERVTHRCIRDKGKLCAYPYGHGEYPCELLPDYKVNPSRIIAWVDFWAPVYPKNFEILGIGPW